MRCLPALGLLALAACNGDTFLLATASLDLVALEFGTVPLEGDATRSIVLSNTGTEVLELYSFTLVQGDSDIFRVDRPDLSEIEGGASVTVPVTFAPEDLGIETGRIQIRTSDEETGPLTVDLSGEGTPSEADNDEDGVSQADGDCDDNRADTYPGAPELCDGRDNDCNGSVPANENDADLDGVRVCEDDCDDADDDVYPGAPEICDDKDSDCDGFERDRDDVDDDGASICDGDCDDADDRVGPGFVEACDGVDNDCDGGVDDLDADGDGHSTCYWLPDCDDQDEDAFPVVVVPGAVGGDGSEALPYGTLTEALAGLDASCRTIALAAGSHDGGVTLTTDVTLVGEGPGTTTLTAEAGTRILRIDGGNVTLRDLSVADGSSVEDGGAIRVDAGSLYAQGVHFTGNASTGGDGGAISLSGGDAVRLVDCVFSDNTASDDGGAIAAFSGVLDVCGTAFDGNAGSDGGAVRFDGTTLVMRDSDFEGNTAGLAGGAVHATADDITLSSLYIGGNTANGAGGGAYVNGEGVVRNVVFHDNTASTTGGGLSVSGDVTVHNDTFVDNVSTGEGAARHAAGATWVHSVLAMRNTGVSGCFHTTDAAVAEYSTVFSTVGADWGGDCSASDAGNTTVNPLFVDLAGGDFTLASGSPAIDSGNPGTDWDDPDGTQNDRGHTGGPNAQEAPCSR